MRDATSTPPLRCPVCGGSTRHVGPSDYYDERGHFPTAVFSCDACDVLVRAVRPEAVTQHCAVASYTRPGNEPRFRAERVRFFERVLDAIEAALPRTSSRPRVCDFGSAFGHLLERAAARGFDAVGVEQSEHLVAECRSRGLSVVRGIDEVPAPIDAITFLDSFYYVGARPIETLAAVREKLRPEGVLFMRLTNRNTYARLGARLGRNLDVLGDATISYSVRGIERVVRAAGFERVRVEPEDPTGKRLDRGTRLAFAVGGALARASRGRVILTPGMIVRAHAPAGRNARHRQPPDGRISAVTSPLATPPAQSET